MKRFVLIFVVIILLNSFLIAHGASPPPPPQGKSQTSSVQQISSLAQAKPKKPLKIKLKRDSKAEYSWEINGESVDDIINTDRKLRKGLGLD
jgi:hypothetical protein